MGDPVRSPRQVPTGWRLVILVGSLSIFGPLCIDMYLPALPGISRELHASASSVQLTLTACLLGISLGQLLLGPISDRLGRRPPLLAGLAAFVGLVGGLCARPEHLRPGRVPADSGRRRRGGDRHLPVDRAGPPFRAWRSSGSSPR